MSIMEEALLNLLKISPALGILGFIAWRQGKRIDTFENDAKEREGKRQTACDEREQRLAARLTQIEERQHGQMASALIAAADTGRINAEAMRINAEATRTFSRSLDRWTDKTGTGSGPHETRGA